jgi:integral membrane protein (TIGR01906 family)
VTSRAAPAASPVGASLGARIPSVVIGLATALAILGASIIPFFSATWTSFEQARAGVVVPGATPAQVRDATDSTVHDLLLSGDFTFRTAGGATFLNAREIQHMRDVRAVFAGFAALVLASIVALLLTAILARRTPGAATRAWRAVRGGAAGLAVTLVVVGAIAAAAFDSLFELFHELFFPAGTFTFDPATDHLVQLFPDQFWFETTLAVSAVAMVASIAVAWFASRRARRTAHAAEAIAASQTAGRVALS